MQEAAKQQAVIDQCDLEIAVLLARKNTAAQTLVAIQRAEVVAAKNAEQQLEDAITSIRAFQTLLSNLKRKQDVEQEAEKECALFLAVMQQLKAVQKARNKPNYRPLAESAALMNGLVLLVQETPTNFEKLHKQYRAIEAHAHQLDEGRPSRRKLGAVMRSAGAALIVLAGFAVLAAVISLFVCPVFLPATTILIAMGAGLALLFGLHMRSTGKAELEGAKPDPEGLPHRLLLFGDALKDKVTQRGPDKISVFEDCRRRWFR